jgi:transcriptional regulator with XRE-family HTH domain
MIGEVMGYRGKLREREAARQLRTQGHTLLHIAERLGVSKSSVSIWVRDVEFEPRPRRRSLRGQHAAPNRLARRKQAEIAQLLAEGRARIGALSERDFLIAGVALYAGEGAKTDGRVRFANTNPAFVAFFCAWLRHFFDVDEARLRVTLYLHEELDLEAATTYWAALTGIPRSQFGKPYRAPADPTIRRTKHELGCPSVAYSCARTHRAIMGLVHGLTAAPFPCSLGSRQPGGGAADARTPMYTSRHDPG